MIVRPPYVQAQPYRRGARQPTQALLAMLTGRPVFLPNPQDIPRLTQLLAGRRF